MADGKLTEVTAMFWGGKYRRLRIILEFLAFMGILLWLFASRHAHAQTAHLATPDWAARKDIGTLQYRMDTLLGPDGTGSQSGTIKMMNDHMHNTDLEVQDQHDFINKLWGAFWGLGGLQALNLIGAFFTGKKVKPQ
jgi:hypothetical protein